MTNPIIPSKFEHIDVDDREAYIETIEQIPTSILRQVVLERDQKNRQADLLRAALSDVHSGTAIMVETFFDAVERIDDKFRNNPDHYGSLFLKAVGEILGAYWATEEREDQRDDEMEKKYLDRKRKQSKE